MTMPRHGKLTSPHDQADLLKWYDRNRCPGSPPDPHSLLGLAAVIIYQDYPRLAEEQGDVLYHGWVAVQHTLRRFRPEKGNQSTPLAARFDQAYPVWLRQLLVQANHQLRRQQDRLRLWDPASFDRLPGWWRPANNGPAREWQRIMLDAAKSRLDERTRLCVQLRRDGKTITEIAARLHLQPKTIANRYSEARVLEAVRGAVRGLVESLAPADRVRLVVYLRWEAGLSASQVAKLLCMSESKLRHELGAAQTRGVPIISHREAVRILQSARAA
jgi:DNA-directed RNA polymerase specialized sigma24 family protein